MKLDVLAYESVFPVVYYLDALFSIIARSILRSTFLMRLKDFRIRR